MIFLVSLTEEQRKTYFYTSKRNAGKKASLITFVLKAVTEQQLRAELENVQVLDFLSSFCSPDAPYFVLISLSI